MDKKKGIIVLLIALVAVWFLFLRGGDIAHGEEGHECAVECHDNADHACADGCASYEAPNPAHGEEGHACDASACGCDGHTCGHECDGHECAEGCDSYVAPPPSCTNTDEGHVCTDACTTE